MPRPPRRTDLEEKGRAMRDVGLYTSIPIMLGVGPFIGWWLGRLAQQRWGGDPWWEVGGVLFGLAGAVRAVYKVLKQESQ